MKSTRKTVLKKKLTEARIKKFIGSANLEIYTSSGKLMSVGVKKGYTRPLYKKGFGQKEIVRILDHLQDNPTKAKRLIKY